MIENMFKTTLMGRITFAQFCSIAVSLASFFAFVTPVNANEITPTPDSKYIIQPGDTLSKLAQMLYGDSSLYSRIVSATNSVAPNDLRITVIEDENQLFVGQVIYIPALEAEIRSVTLVKTPSESCDVRIWYNYQVVALQKINQYWIEQGFNLKERALMAYMIRHNARINARYLMADRQTVAKIQKRDLEKYGNPDGPTFEYLYEQHRKEGLAEDEIYQEIIESSSRTSPVYNDKCT